MRPYLGRILSGNRYGLCQPYAPGTDCNSTVRTVLGLAGVSFTLAVTYYDLPYSVGHIKLSSGLRTPQYGQVGFTDGTTPHGLRTGHATWSHLLAFVVRTALP